MKVKVFVTSLLIAVLSGCEVSEPTSPSTAPLNEAGAPSPELFRQPLRPRKIALPGIPAQVIFSSEFVAIELDAGAISQGTAAASSTGCPDEAEVETFMDCMTSLECGGLADQHDLTALLERASNATWISGILAGQVVIVTNDSAGEFVIGPGSNSAGQARSAMGGRELPGATASPPSLMARVMGSASVTADLTCGESLGSTCLPDEQCPGGSTVKERVTLDMAAIARVERCLRNPDPIDCPPN